MSVLLIDEDENMEAVADPFGLGGEGKCPTCGEPLGQIRYTTSWAWGKPFCSPECRDKGIEHEKRISRWHRRRRKKHCTRRLEEAKQHRSIVVPRAMLKDWGHRVWKGQGRPKGDCYKRNGRWIKFDSKQGPVQASYSADTIGKGQIRRPFQIGGELFIYMGGCTWDFHVAVEVYKLVLPEEFEGPTFTYAEKTAIPHSGDGYSGDGEFSRRDPNGFYHGMTARFGKQTYVVQGPKVYLLPDAKEPKPARQKCLF